MLFTEMDINPQIIRALEENHIASPTEIQERNCTDTNACGTFRSKPPEKRACIYGEDIPIIDEPIE